MYEMIIVGAGPAGISMAAEARAAGIHSEQILVLEKGATHSWAIRKYYPAAKVVLANYKGIEAVCAGVMCISDMSKEETLTYVDRTIKDYEPVIKEGYETSVPGLFLIGDLSAGKKGGSINLAFNMAAEAMQSICGRSPKFCESAITSELATNLTV